MADLPNEFQKINDIEVASDAPLTEALHRKYGSNINALIDADLSDTFIITSGSGNFIVPAGVSAMQVQVAGAGGGGGGGYGNPGFVSGGAGGGGSLPISFLLQVTEGQAIPYAIGSGGAGGAGVNSGTSAGDGGDGGSTFFNNREFFGAPGGLGGRISSFGAPPLAGIGTDPVFDRYRVTTAGGDASYPASAAGTGTVRPAQPGENTQYAAGGAAGSTSGINDAGGGGGGGAGVGAGGAGANGTNTAGAGFNGSAGGQSAGGGGGGGNGNVGPGGNGGAGGNGYILITFARADFTNV